MTIPLMPGLIPIWLFASDHRFCGRFFGDGLSTRRDGDGHSGRRFAQRSAWSELSEINPHSDRKPVAHRCIPAAVAWQQLSTSGHHSTGAQHDMASLMAKQAVNKRPKATALNQHQTRCQVGEKRVMATMGRAWCRGRSGRCCLGVRSELLKSSDETSEGVISVLQGAQFACLCSQRFPGSPDRERDQVPSYTAVVARPSLKFAPFRASLAAMQNGVRRFCAKPPPSSAMQSPVGS